MEKQPPTDPLHRKLWAMGHDKKARDAIIDHCTKMTVACGVPFEPAIIGRLCMPEMKLPKQKWYVRLKFWLRRMWWRICDTCSHKY